MITWCLGSVSVDLIRAEVKVSASAEVSQPSIRQGMSIYFSFDGTIFKLSKEWKLITSIVLTVTSSLDPAILGRCVSISCFVDVLLGCHYGIGSSNLSISAANHAVIRVEREGLSGLPV